MKMGSKEILGELSHSTTEEFKWIASGSHIHQSFTLTGYQKDIPIIILNSEDFSSDKDMIDRALILYNIWDDLKKQFPDIKFIPNDDDRKNRGDICCDDQKSLVRNYLKKYPKLKVEVEPSNDWKNINDPKNVDYFSSPPQLIGIFISIYDPS
jgi:hypothetical protein